MNILPLSIDAGGIHLLIYERSANFWNDRLSYYCYKIFLSLASTLLSNQNVLRNNVNARITHVPIFARMPKIYNDKLLISNIYCQNLCFVEQRPQHSKLYCIYVRVYVLRALEGNFERSLRACSETLYLGVIMRGYLQKKWSSTRGNLRFACLFITHARRLTKYTYTLYTSLK